MEKPTSSRLRKYAQRVRDKLTVHGVSDHNYEPFNYDSVPLRTASTQIRLLKVFPASKYSDPLHCQLFTTTLSRAPRYRALSYVWGDGTKTHTLSVAAGKDGQHHHQQQKIPITSSLNTALRHLRSLPTLDPDAIPIVIWIDQICINQTDDDEKSYQVQLMGQIYSRAMKVLVWLGPAADGSDEVMDALAELGREYVKCGERVLGEGFEWAGHVHAFMREHWTTTSSTVSAEEGEEENDDDNWQPGQEVQDLFERTLRTVMKLEKGDKLKEWYTRPWFTRIWTIQEFCLCEDTVFVCGSKIAHSSAVGVAIRLINFIFLDWDLDAEGLQRRTRPELVKLRENKLRLKWLEGSVVSLLDSRDIKSMSPAELTLLPLMKLLYVPGDEDYGPQATRYRDRVYGLLGLASDSEKLGIVPEYSSDKAGIVKVLTDTARAFVERGGTLEVLSFAAQGPKLKAEEMEPTSTQEPTREAQEGSATTLLMELPSWVPDWRAGLLPSYYVIENRKEGDERVPLFAPCGDSTEVEVVPTPESPYVLGLRGYLVDTIEECSEHVWSDQTLEENDYGVIVEYFASLERLCRLSEEKENRKESERERIYKAAEKRQQEALCRVAVGDQFFVMEKGYQRMTSEMVQNFEEWLASCRMKAPAPKSGKSIVSQEDLDSEEDANGRGHRHRRKRKRQRPEKKKALEGLEWTYDAGLAPELAMTLDLMRGKRPYLTQNGYLGMAPSHALPGDVVVFFLGAEIAHVLRPVEGKEGMNNAYALVGEAYCDGVMDGDIVLTKEKSEFFLV